ncbi:MAG: hypothetical protein FWC87_03095 [Acidimicrobiaceae bacterium]|nr:hypothetical protein [Acidimicrobiaceae bacterium]
MSEPPQALPRPAHGRRRSGDGATVDGPEANGRLTATVGVVLLVMLAVEGVTILRIHRFLSLHVFVGLLLVPPVVLKTASTGWRFARYYLGDSEYRRKGPPHPVLRILGPFVVILTAILFASGVALLFVPASWHGRMLTLHKASFILWFGATTIHVLGHLIDVGRLAPADWVRRGRSRAKGVWVRQGAVAASIVAGLALATALIGQVNHYRTTFTFFH